MAYSNILIAVDGSKFSENAVKRGIELAKQLSASVTLLCVIDFLKIVANAEGEVVNPEVFNIFEDDATLIVNQLAKKYSYPKTKKMTVEGMPTEAILKTAKSLKADLIIMGTHGRKGLSHLFLGSVAEYVIRHSTLPTMVVPMI